MAGQEALDLFNQLKVIFPQPLLVLSLMSGRGDKQGIESLIRMLAQSNHL